MFFLRKKKVAGGRQNIAVLGNELVDFVLPPRCVVSGKPVERQGMVAPEIWAKLNFISAPFCDCCGRPFEFHQQDGLLCGECLAKRPPFARARAALAYDDGSRELVLRFKHGDQMHAVLAFLPWMMRAGAELFTDADFLVPVPLHRWRLLRRRYNQAAVIAHRLARETNVPFLPDPLVRLRSTPPQGHLGAKDRVQNVRRAFEVKPFSRAIIEGRNLVLIDDVYTTGATASECASALLKAGCARVDVLTLARVVRPGCGY